VVVGAVVEDAVEPKPELKFSIAPAMNTFIRPLSRCSPRCLALALTLALAPGLFAADSAKTFSTPDEAVAALVSAINAKDTDALGVLFGPAYEELVNPDRVQATNEFNAVSDAIAQGTRLVRDRPDHCVAEFGADHWPFPVPLVQRAGQWSFDTAAGKEEILNRRIGKNELSALQSARACVQAQREYASRDRDGDEVLEYAQRIPSSPGRKDGLYWSPELDGELSPLGPLMADAQAEGYDVEAKADSEVREPFHGYFFKILTRQGKHAPGGKYDFIINGNMIGGFALVAWPADYGNSGIMTFIVNQQGRVYQKDLGAKTAKLAPEMKAYDPDSTWAISPQ
jgi:hypothetical protein